jgi:hypothetical protein
MAADPRIAWLLNLDADRELQDPLRYRPAGRRDSAGAWHERTADLVAREDLVLDDDIHAALALRKLRPEDCVVQVFCPTPRALARVTSLGFAAPPAPALEILRQANDRSFCASVGQTLPGAAFVRDMRALERHLEQPSPTGTYVVKRAFSFAGREQRRVQHGVLDASTRGFCARSFANREGLQIEPWVERLADFCRHAYLSRAGALSIGAAREQRIDPLGRFLGVSTGAAALTPAEHETLAAELKLTASALGALGYFGPFGIDAFRYRSTQGEVLWNPRCEINARFTMGYPRALLLAGLELRFG